MLAYHPLANLFPLIEGQAFADLVEDIRSNGLHERIIILDGMILDGRNRYRAAISAGVIDRDELAKWELPLDADGFVLDPHLGRVQHQVTRHFEAVIDGKLAGSNKPIGDALTWVLSKNLHRRHLDESQRSAVAARLETVTHGGARAASDGEQDASLQLTRAEISKIVNVSPRTIASSKKVLNEGAPELFQAIESGKVKASVAEKLLTLPKAQQVEAATMLDARRLPNLAKQAKRSDTEKRLGERQRALPTKQYNVIYADPAWRFEPRSRETGLDRAADNHYPTQATEEIMALPVGTLAATDCVLLLWATAPMICDALRVMRFWGFEYKSQFVWVKPHFGNGYWNRNRHELLLVGTRGNIPCPAPGEQWDSVIEAPAGAHSVKPDKGYELIESYFPSLPKIELNARRARHGWDAWGLEAPEVADAEATEGEEGGSALPSSSLNPRKTYELLVDGSTIKPGTWSHETAEPIFRAAYACTPIVPMRELSAVLGHPMGTIKRWANRYGVTDTARQKASQFTAANAR